MLNHHESSESSERKNVLFADLMLNYCYFSVTDRDTTY
jgi:hypothetical protein